MFMRCMLVYSSFYNITKVTSLSGLKVAQHELIVV